MRLGSAVIVGIGILAVCCSCGQRTVKSFTAAGSTAFQPFAEKLAEQYMAAHPDVSISIQGGGSAVGIQSARSGAAQLGMADLPELPPEAGELSSTVVARDGIVIIVNPANPVDNLSMDQVRDVFSGIVTNWRQVGGVDQPIRVISREAGSGTRTSFEKIAGGIRVTATALVQDSNGTIRESVANDPAAVGYLSHGLVNDKVKPLSIDGAHCVEVEIKAGRYRLVRPVFFLTKGPASGVVKDFIAYVMSPEGQSTIRDNGLLPAAD